MPIKKIQKIFMRTGLLVLILGLIWSCSFLGDRGKGQYIPIEIDLDNTIGPFNGLGANVPISFYSRRIKPLQTLNDLGITVIRVKRQGDNWDNILALRGATQRLGIKWIYSLDAIPASLVNQHGQLTDVAGFAEWWAEEVDELFYQEVPADFIELLDVPDLAPGDSLPLSPDIYNSLVKATRVELDLRGYQQVEIIGPGLSTPAISGDLESWYMDLDQTAFDILGHWTVQTWEKHTKAGQVGSALAELIQYLDLIESRKPIFVSSYASSETVFGQRHYPDPNQYDQLGNLNTFQTYYYSASFSVPYALRVYSNTLDLLKYAGVTPIIYQLYDAPVDVKHKKRSWGLLDLNGQAKPVFTLLGNLMQQVPKQAMVVPAEIEPEHQLNALAFRNQEQVMLTICNENTKSKSVQVRLHGARRSLEFVHAVDCQSPKILPPGQGQVDEIEILETELKLRHDGDSDSYTFTATIHPQSTFVAEFQLK